MSAAQNPLMTNLGGREEAIDALTLSRYLTEGSPLPLVVTVGPAHIVRYVNPAFCGLVERSAEDLIGEPLPKAMPEDVEDGLPALLDKVYRTGEAESLPDQQHRSPNGDPGYWSYAAWATCDAAERPTGVIVQVANTTEQTLMRQRAVLLNQTLMLSGLHQHELTELAEGGIRELQRSLRETDHRAKNNLQTIGAILDIHAMRNAESVTGAQLAQVQHSIQTLAAMHGLLTRLGHTGSAKGTLSATAMLRVLLPMWQELIGTTNLRWSADEVALPVKKGMSLALLTNELITNARKHGAQAVELRLAVHEDSATLDVSDDGPGFPPDFDLSTSAHFGLEFVESVVRVELSGKVTFTNNRGGGACVGITFPLPTPSSINRDLASVPFS